MLQAVEADMAMVDIRLLHSLDDIGNSQIRRMLEELGVRHISPQEVIQHHILPVLKSEEKWKVGNYKYLLPQSYALSFYTCDWLNTKSVR